MRKILYITAAVIVLSALLLPGCGAKKEVKTNSRASEIIEKASLNMQQLKTLKAKVFYSMKSAKQGAQDMTYSFDIESDKTDPSNPSTKMVMRGGGQTADMFITGGYAYMAVPGKGWYKSPVKQESLQEQASPEDISKYTKGAENIRLTREDRLSYTISFKIGKKFLEDQIKSQMGERTEATKEYQQYMEQILKGLDMSCIFRISKKDLLIEKANINMKMKNMPVIGDVDLTMIIEFSDLNKPLAIKLPQEAEKAQETQELPGQVGIPGFPGLGF